MLNLWIHKNMYALYAHLIYCPPLPPPLRNLHDFMPGQGRGISRGVGRGRGLTYEHKLSPRNSVSRGSWGDGNPFDDTENTTIMTQKDQSPEKSVSLVLLAEIEKPSVPGKSDSNSKQQFDAHINIAGSSSSPNHQLVTNAQNCSTQLNNSNSDSLSVKTSTNASINIAGSSNSPNHQTVINAQNCPTQSNNSNSDSLE